MAIHPTSNGLEFVAFIENNACAVKLTRQPSASTAIISIVWPIAGVEGVESRFLDRTASNFLCQDIEAYSDGRGQEKL